MIRRKDARKIRAPVTAAYGLCPRPSAYRHLDPQGAAVAFSTLTGPAATTGWSRSKTNKFGTSKHETVGKDAQLTVWKS